MRITLPPASGGGAAADAVRPNAASPTQAVVTVKAVTAAGAMLADAKPDMANSSPPLIAAGIVVESAGGAMATPVCRRPQPAMANSRVSRHRLENHAAKHLGPHGLSMHPAHSVSGRTARHAEIVRRRTRQRLPSVRAVNRDRIAGPMLLPLLSRSDVRLRRVRQSLRQNKVVDALVLPRTFLPSCASRLDR